MNKTKVSDRVCVGGSDGGASCGHDDRYFYQHSDPVASACMFEDEQGKQCGHRCVFSDSDRVERHELTHDEQVKLARRVMREQVERDLEVGRELARKQQRIIRIREGDDDCG